MKYQKRNQAQRYVLETLIHPGHSNQSIAEELGVHRTTVWRKRRRHSIPRGQDKGGYPADKAQLKAIKREKGKQRRIWWTGQPKEPIKRWMIKDRFSPERISAYWNIHGMESVSTERIYRWLWTCKRGNKTSDAPYKL